MRQRITFLHRPQDAVDPSTFKVLDSSLTGPVLPAVREDRVTLALDELPDALRQVLQSSHELHVRWVSPHPYDTVSPLFSRLSPGFHLFYTPQPESLAQDDGRLCKTLQEVFGQGLDCNSAQTSFTTLPNDRFSHATAYQYYSPLESLRPLIAYAHSTLCPPPSATTPEGSSCASRVDRLSTASSLDVSWDTISHALKVTAQWTYQDEPLIVTSPLDANNHRVEVGVLASDPTQHGVEPHEIGLAGVLTVLGQDKKPSPTVFKFPARHRRAEGGAFTASFLEPTGLHPSLQLRLNSAAIRPPPGAADGACALHTHLTLPRAVFADKYQLSDPLFLASKNLSALRYTSQPVDLEAPDYVMKLWGSAALLELSLPPPPELEAELGLDAWTAEVPLHLRYLAPAPGGYRDVEVPYPAVFWACTTEEGTKFPSSPFERVNLGYDGLFGPRTVFWHVDPQPVAGAEGGDARLTSGLRVPVLDVDRAGWVGIGTTVVVALGFGWIVWKLVQLYLKTGYGPAQQMEGLVRKKKEQ
ncbi:PIG-X-domain-containing protein [Cryphonectria parasitica EP155]|uniref:Protein PBN1 n=1 Tax=Cryphonectria parasitica (strain ATCC 38755 / EP155) TaxID=660469 RepID=A0A9P5CUQ5_CRYP1|nr:PIG-X-domain-containing protein [Cryphonectria parasitica EP155]KAF3770240.1 PIG-X-domain-containing protein [Cryphonectria parasitica EP155]